MSLLLGAVYAYAAMILVILATILTIAVKGIKGPIFRNPLTQMTEQMYLFIEGLCLSVIGPHGRKYIPFLSTLWMIIFVSNISGLVLPHTTTADWSLNLSMAIIVISYVQYEGFLMNYNSLRGTR